MDKKVEIKRMIIISNEFYRITKLSEKSALQINRLELIPIVVNCAFSIELSLKSLYYAINNKKTSGHNLKLLYNSVKMCGLEKYLLSAFTSNEIDKIIDELENAFVEFRYLYEQKKIIIISSSLLKDFILFVNSFCNRYINYNVK